MIAERGHALRHTEAEQARRQDRGQGRGGGRVGVLVRGHVEALVARPLQHRDGLGGPAPDGPGAALQVRDLQARFRHSGGVRDANRGDRLGQRREQPRAFVAHVRGVHPSAPRGGGDQGGEFLRVGMHARRIDQPG